VPELPEVETVARSLRRTVVGSTIASVEIRKTDRIFPNKRRFAGILSGAAFRDVRRRGKNLLIDLSNNYTLWVHLKMTGHFYLLPSSVPFEKHDHIIFHLAGDNTDLRFNDYRRFGRLRLYPTSEIMKRPGLADLGPEPLEMTADEFVSLLRLSHRMIKPALLDQTFIAGIGNIYADESLFRARIHPRRLTDSLSKKKIEDLHFHLQYILRKAIRLMGTSVDTFAGLNGDPGRFQKYLLVYGREGEPCPRCGGPIRREKIGSRSSHFCPRCQRRP
jgi:formamidopyrimidine-DNA glycosylase